VFPLSSPHFLGYARSSEDKSTFEARQEKLKRSITKIEEQSGSLPLPTSLALLHYLLLPGLYPPDQHFSLSVTALAVCLSGPVRTAG